MTSGIFKSIAISDITITDRIRKKKRSDYDRLKRSIDRRGLLHPIVVDRNHILVAGEGRITACRELGWTNIPCQYTDELDPDEQEMLEAEENDLREDLTWEELHTFYLRRIAYLRKKNPDISLNELAEELNLDRSQVGKHLLFEEKKDNPVVQQIAKQSGFDAGYRAAVRISENEYHDKLIHNGVSRPTTPKSPILTADFNTWAPNYLGPPHNLIHVDFPYGIEAQNHAGQNAALTVEYDDRPETYDRLFDTLCTHLDNFCAESAHMIFWFSPRFYSRTWEMLKALDGFVFDPYPLVWQRGENEGIAPDPARRPRRVYEMAFFGWRNDRKIIRTKANSIVAPTDRSRHPHEKSVVALKHFFEMCVDANTRLFDPTCGSASALRAARALGAQDVLGLESNPEYADLARRALESGSDI